MILYGYCSESIQNSFKIFKLEQQKDCKNYITVGHHLLGTLTNNLLMLTFFIPMKPKVKYLNYWRYMMSQQQKHVTSNLTTGQLKEAKYSFTKLEESNADDILFYAMIRLLLCC